MDTIAKQNIDAIKTRLQAILVAGGFNTNAGAQVYVGRRSFDENDTLPAVTVFDNGEQSEEIGSKRVRNELVVSVEGFAAPSGDSLTATSDLVGDIKKAVLLDDVSLGGLAQYLGYRGYSAQPPRDGGTISSVLVNFSVVYDERYGDPYTSL